MVLYCFRQVFDREVVDGRLEAELRNVPGKTKRDEKDCEDDLAGVFNNVPEPGFGVRDFGEFRHWFPLLKKCAYSEVRME